MNTARELSTPKSSPETSKISLPLSKPMSPSENIVLSKKTAVIPEGSLNSPSLKASFQGFSTPPRTFTGQSVVFNSPVRKLFHSTSAPGNFCRNSIDGLASASPVSSAMESLSFCKIVTSEASSPLRPSGMFSDLGNEKPCSDQLSGDEAPPTPRAPVKPNRIRSLKTFFPGKTRRKLDFDEF